MKFLVTILMLVMLLPVWAQENRPLRFETEYDWGTDDFMVIPNDEKGLLVVRAERSMTGKEFTTWFTHLNKDFEVEWTDSIHVPKTFYIKGYDFNGAKNFILLQDKTERRDLKIIRIDPYNNSLTEFEPRRLTEIDITDFDVIQNSAVIGGYIDNRPAAFVYDMDNDNLKTLNNVYQNKSQLLEVKINSDSVTFNVVASVIDEKKDRTILVNTYDFEGNPVRDYELRTREDHQLITAISSSIMNIEQVIVGLYSYKVGTSPSGFYVNHVDRTGQQTMRYMPFGQFKTFFEHEGETRGEKLKAKSLDWHTRDKAFRYKTDAIFRKIIEEDGELVVLAEFYKPWATTSYDLQRIRSRSNPFYYANGGGLMPNSNWMSDPSSVSEKQSREFDFTHAFAFALDQSGNLKWDHNYEIDESVEGLLTSYGEFHYHQQNAYFVHYYDEEFVVEYLNREDQEQEPKVFELDLLYENDELRYEDENFKGILPWYDNKIIVFGIQHIRAEDKSTPLRKVFFVNGVTIGLDMEADVLKD